MPRSSINMLAGLSTGEISLVLRGANNKRNALVKSQEDAMKFAEMLKSVLATEAEGEAKFVETLKGADENTISAAVAHYRMQHGFKDLVSKDMFAEVAKANGYELAKAAKAKADHEDDDEENENPFAPKDKKKKKDKTTKTAPVVEDLPENVQALFKAQSSQIEALEKSSEKDREDLRKERTKRIRKEYVHKCEKEYSHVPGMSADEMADMLLKSYAVSKEFGEGVEKQWKQTNEAVAKSNLLVAQGVIATNDGSSGAWAKMNAIAKSMVDAKPGLSKSAAITAAIEANPQLYVDYLEENPAQRGG